MDKLKNIVANDTTIAIREVIRNLKSIDGFDIRPEIKQEILIKLEEAEKISFSLIK
jgi:hypothetical protein